MDENNNNVKNVLIDRIFFLIALILYTILVLNLFNNQASGDNCDYEIYVNYLLGEKIEAVISYPLYFDMSKIIAGIIKDEAKALAIAAAILNVLSVIITKFSLEWALKKELVNNKKINIISTIFTFIMVFSSMIVTTRFFKVTIPNHFLGVFSPNPWHNPTYIAAKPFAILSFVLFIKILDKYENTSFKEMKSDYIWFAISLFLATIAKPSYTLIQIVVSFCIMLYRFIRSKGKNIKESLVFGLCYIPTIFNMLYQYMGVFQSNGDTVEDGIAIGWLKVWRIYTNSVTISVFFAIAFPIVVLFFHHRDLFRNTLYRVAWIFYGFGLLSIAVIYESGPRAEHFNFAWGYMYGLFFLFFVSIVLCLKDLFSIFDKKQVKEGRNKVFLICFIALTELSMLLVHFVCGIYYFITVYKGTSPF